MKSKQNETFVYQSVANGDIEIREDGTIWRRRKRGWDRWKSEAISRPCRPVRAEHNSGQYFQVRAMLNGRRVVALAHRMVWLHFNGQIPEEMTINHRNGIKKDNRPENLELATHQEQQIHATRVLKVGHACDQHGLNNSMAKLTPDQVLRIRQRRLDGEALKSISADFGVTAQTISKIAKGQRRSIL